MPRVSANGARDAQRTCAECKPNSTPFVAGALRRDNIQAESELKFVWLPIGRRRKIRCTYNSNSSSECARCLSRGTLCVSPKDNTPSDEKGTLRARVSQLEALVASLTQAQQNDNVLKQTASAILHTHSDSDDEELDDTLPEVTRGAPLVAVLEASQVLK